MGCRLSMGLPLFPMAYLVGSFDRATAVNTPWPRYGRPNLEVVAGLLSGQHCLKKARPAIT